MRTAREISEEPKGRAGARSHAFPLPEPGLIPPELRDTGAESRGHPPSSRHLEAAWSLSSRGRRRDPVVTLKQQENHLWVAEAHTSPPTALCPPPLL